MRTRDAEERGAIRSVAPIVVGRQDTAAVFRRSRLGDDMHGRLLPQIAEDKLHITGSRELAGAS
ncbi:hypothetical protein D3C85_1692100 [compost metagenome]